MCGAERMHVRVQQVLVDVRVDVRVMRLRFRDELDSSQGVCILMHNECYNAENRMV